MRTPNFRARGGLQSNYLERSVHLSFCFLLDENLFQIQKYYNIAKYVSTNLPDYVSQTTYALLKNTPILKISIM